MRHMKLHSIRDHPHWLRPELLLCTMGWNHFCRSILIFLNFFLVYTIFLWLTQNNYFLHSSQKCECILKITKLLQEEFQPIVSKLSAELSDWRGRKLGSILAHYYIQSSLLFKWITKWLNKQPHSRHQLKLLFLS